MEPDGNCPGLLVAPYAAYVETEKQKKQIKIKSTHWKMISMRVRVSHKIRTGQKRRLTVAEPTGRIVVTDWPYPERREGWNFDWIWHRPEKRKHMDQTWNMHLVDWLIDWCSLNRYSVSWWMDGWMDGLIDWLTDWSVMPLTLNGFRPSGSPNGLLSELAIFERSIAGGIWILCTKSGWQE